MASNYQPLDPNTDMTSNAEIAAIMTALGLEKQNPGSCFAPSAWSEPGQQLIQSINPASGQIIAEVFASSAKDYQQVIQASVDAGEKWRQTPAPLRGEVIRLLGERLRVHKDALGSLVTLETGKLKQEGDGEVQEMIDIADFAVGQSRMLYGKTMHSERPMHRMYEQWHPLGMVGVFSAFNFPVAVWAWNAFIAAIAGNTVVWKPSPKAPLTAIAVQRLCNQVLQETGFGSVFTLVIPDNNQIAEDFVKDKRVDLISFTGSSAVGRLVAENVAARMGKSLLELSGNNAVIIDETADIKLAIPSTVFGSVGTTGQRCTSTRRLFIHASRFDEVAAQLAAAYKQVKIGNPMRSEILMGPLIDEVAVNLYKKAVADVIHQGGEILAGGQVIDAPGFFVEPTLVKANNDWPVVQRETFAPILYLMPFKTLDEAIRMQNNVVQGLSSALFTESMRHAEQFLSAFGSDCGIANINIGTSGAEIGGAFGGEKETGGGREAGSDSWKAYMRRQTNTINWGKELPLAQGIEFKLS